MNKMLKTNPAVAKPLFFFLVMPIIEKINPTIGKKNASINPTIPYIPSSVLEGGVVCCCCGCCCCGVGLVVVGDTSGAKGS